MNRRTTIILIFMLFAMGLSFIGCGESVNAITETRFIQREAPKDREETTDLKKIEPQADAILKQFSEYVRGLKSFRVDTEGSLRVEMSLDSPGDHSENVPHTKTDIILATAIALQRPNKVAIQQTIVTKAGSDFVQEIKNAFICDGTYLYSSRPSEKTYTVVGEAPDNLNAIAEEVDKYMKLKNKKMPVVFALLQDNPYEHLMESVNQAAYMGTEIIDGVNCHHLKLSRDEGTLEMWVDAGKQPLLKKIVPDISEMFAQAGLSDKMTQMMKEMKMKMEAETVFKDWAVNVDLPEDLFKPEGEEKKPAATQPAARQILDKMAHVYASCQTYMDKGVVTTVFFRNDRKRTAKKPFTTAFVRPDRFRFEFKARRGEEEWDRYIVWRDGKSVQTWWDVQPGIGKGASLSMALGAALGVSSGSAGTIPSLLMPDKGISGKLLTSMTDLELLAEEDVDGVPCVKVQGKDFRGETITLWIEKEMHLLRKIFEHKTFPDFRTETTTTYQPQINVDIPPEALKFNPPQNK